MTRKKDVDWNLPEKLLTWEQVNTAILMDIRDELRGLNQKLSGVGPTVHAIERNTRKITCKQCRKGPFVSHRGLHQHVTRMHRAAA